MTSPVGSARVGQVVSIGAGLVLALGVTAGPARADATPALTVAAPDGLIGSAFAVNADGSKLAYVLVSSGAHTATLKVVTIPAGKEAASLDGVPVPERLFWVGADRVLVVEATGGQERAWSIPIAGPVPATGLGPVDRVAVTVAAGAPTIVTYTAASKGSPVHEVAAYGPDDLHVVKTVTLAETGGRIDHPDGKIIPLWWADGGATLVGRRPGAYDPVKDIRLPHVLVRLDVLAGSVTTSALPVAGFARVTAEHRKRAGQGAFVYRRGGEVRLVSGADTRVLALARAPDDYYDGSFHSQLVGDKLVFSATSRRHPKDPDRVEIYRVDLAAGEPTQILAVPAKQRFVHWHVAGGRLAILRARQGALGGPSIDVHDLAIE